MKNTNSSRQYSYDIMMINLFSNILRNRSILKLFCLWTLKYKNEKSVTFFGFSPFDVEIDVPEGTFFAPLLSSFGLSIDVDLIPLSFVVLELMLELDDTGFPEDEEFLRAGFPGWAEGRKYPKLCNNDSAAARLASFLFGPVPCAFSPATFTCKRNRFPISLRN